MLDPPDAESLPLMPVQFEQIQGPPTNLKPMPLAEVRALLPGEHVYVWWAKDGNLRDVRVNGVFPVEGKSCTTPPTRSGITLTIAGGDITIYDEDAAQPDMHYAEWGGRGLAEFYHPPEPASGPGPPTVLALKLAAHPNFRWVKGMRACRDTLLGHWDIVGAPDPKTGEPWTPANEAVPSSWYPSLEASGSAGGLLMLLDRHCSEAWTLTRHPKGWVVTGHTHALRPGPLYNSAGEALAHALLEVWGDIPNPRSTP